MPCNGKCNSCNKARDGQPTKPKSIKFTPRIQKGGDYGDKDNESGKGVEK